MESVDKLTSANRWHHTGTAGTYTYDDPADSAKDLKGYLSGLGKSRLILLASKYKIRICKTRRRLQIVESFLCRVPSDMIEPICSELEREERERRPLTP